ncbi:MAG: 23S rRNA (adenine(2503)-C(2))-methyltransferase RlmN [Pontiellaceae bacterium]|jgi:23S rRNA (adenine2503-C2)-methyltransferase|nr:23S rRNA (adenine(2503)-C(2))-methyltransferase RlmN [Pontiellaceae bacterium]
MKLIWMMERWSDGMKSVYNVEVLEELVRDPYQRKKFCNAFFKKALPIEVCLKKLPDMARTLSFQCMEIVERHDSKRDGATRLVLQTADGHRVEAVVLRIATGRTSLCISSQIGCSVGCKFCATAKLGFIRNLTFVEMLDQVLLAKRLLCEEGRTLRNVVVMGMGEPLRNEENLFQCLEILRDPQFFNLSENHLLVSTVGLPDAMARFAYRFPKIPLALSLHSARQEVRERLIPIAKFQTLEKLKAVFPKLGNPVAGMGRSGSFMVEYLLLKGINDSHEDLIALMNLLRGADAHINLIQFNTYPGAPFEPVSTEAREAFGKELRKAGFKTTLRYSLGDDIAAACGQLAGK